MKTELILKGVKDDLNAVIAVLVNSGYSVYWTTRKINGKEKKVLVVDDRKGDKE